jgi:hypothetical protein
MRLPRDGDRIDYYALMAIGMFIIVIVLIIVCGIIETIKVAA